MSFVEMISEVIDPESREWSPSLRFFRSGRAGFKLPDQHDPLELEWEFQSSRPLEVPIAFTVCEMKGLGFELCGYGDHLLLSQALRQSFAEAWERMWMSHMGRHEESISSSNGFAAGKTAKQALLGSRAELLERAMLLEAWASRRGWEPYGLRGWLSRLLKAYFQAKGFRISFFLLREASGLGEVMVGVHQHSERGVAIDSTFVSRSYAASELKIIRSMVRSAMIMPHTPISELPARANPSDHGHFYQNPAHAEAFDFLNEDTHRAPISLPEANAIQSELVADIEGLPFVARSMHPGWPELKWGKESIRGDNPWPHPLA